MPAVVQTQSTSSVSNNTLSVTLSNQASGNLLVVCGAYSASYNLAVSDTGSNIYALDATGSGWSQLGFNVWSSKANSGNNTITISGVNAGRIWLVAREVSGATTNIIVVGSGTQSDVVSGNTQSITPTSGTFVYSPHIISNVSGNLQYASGWTSGVGIVVGNSTLLDEYNASWPGNATNCPASTQFQDSIWDNLGVAYSGIAVAITAFFQESGPKRQYRREGGMR